MSAAYAAASLLVMWLSGAYRPRINYRLWTQLPALFGELTVATLLVAVWPDPHRIVLLERLPFTVAVVIAGRLATYQMLRMMRSHSSRREDALIIGADRPARVVADALLRSRTGGIRPVGFIAPPDAWPGGDLPVLGDLAQLDEVIERLGIKHVIVADAAHSQASLSTRLWYCQARDVVAWVVPPLFDFGTCVNATDDWTIAFQHLRRPGQHTAGRLVKRAFDVIVAGATLLLTAPVLALVTLAVRVTSAGPVFFRQKRIGQNGREFELLKFRTMMVNDDSDTMWSVTNVRRMTPIGQFLRRSCLDELPQLLNVIRGDMSLVGPRPERPYFSTLFSDTVPNYADRLRVPVGITGWSQIHGLRGDTSIADRTRFDNFYIEHWSLFYDVFIMLKTVSAVIQWLFRREEPPAAEARPEPAALAPVSIPAGARSHAAVGASQPADEPYRGRP